VQKPNPDGVVDVTWYSQLHHLQNGQFSAFSARQGSDIGTTTSTARTVMDKAAIMMTCLERGVIHDADGTIWDAGGLRVEVRAIIKVGSPLSVADVQCQLGPWLSLSSQQQKLQEYVDLHSAGTIVLRKLEFPVPVVVRQANICLFLLAKGLQAKAGRSKLTKRSTFLLLLLASCVGYSNPRWYSTFLRLAAGSTERRLLMEIYEAIYSRPTASALPFAFAVPIQPQVRL